MVQQEAGEPMSFRGVVPSFTEPHRRPGQSARQAKHGKQHRRRRRAAAVQKHASAKHCEEGGEHHDEKRIPAGVVCEEMASAAPDMQHEQGAEFGGSKARR